MKWKKFAKKIEPLLEPNEPITSLGFKFNNATYKIVSQWGSGNNREYVNLWAKKTKDNSNRIYPFCAALVNRLEFFKIKEVKNVN